VSFDIEKQPEVSGEMNRGRDRDPVEEYVPPVGGRGFGVGHGSVEFVGSSVKYEISVIEPRNGN
jgi:hypothetical protein